MKYEINWIISTKQAHLTFKLAYKKTLKIEIKFYLKGNGQKMLVRN